MTNPRDSLGIYSENTFNIFVSIRESCLIMYVCMYVCIYLFIYFWPHHTACRILVPQPGIEPWALSSESTES